MGNQNRLIEDLAYRVKNCCYLAGAGAAEAGGDGVKSLRGSYQNLALFFYSIMRYKLRQCLTSSVENLKNFGVSLKVVFGTACGIRTK